MKYKALIPVLSKHDKIEKGEVFKIEHFQAYYDSSYSFVEIITKDERKIHLPVSYVLHFCERVPD